jgi:hypothetical protein
VEKLVRSIARRFGCKNYFERSSKVFHKLRANFPQVFPQAFLKSGGIEIDITHSQDTSL